MLYTIENKYLRITANTCGAELKSIVSLDEELERLWQGDEKSWTGQAPLLFPLIGRLKEERYDWAGKSYSMPIHGFANRSEFTYVPAGENTLSFTLTDTPETYARYPFHFRLTVRYVLQGRTIRKEHTVENLTDGEMLYELGGHEGYNIALYAGERMAQYYAEFKNDGLMTYTTDEAIMFNEGLSPVAMDGRRIYLDREVFANDALVLANAEDGTVTIGCGGNGRRITVCAPDFPYLGLWTMYRPFDTNYICVEPWSSLPDCNYLGYDLKDKPGVRTLAAHETETLAYTITVE